MFVIGERINGMFNDIKKAIQNKDKGPLQDHALKQAEAGANALDINVGPATVDKEGAMVWMVETVREVSDITICVDTAKFEAMKAGLEAAGGSLILNSTKGDDKNLDLYLPLAKEHDASVIILIKASEITCDRRISSFLKGKTITLLRRPFALRLTSYSASSTALKVFSSLL